MAERKNLFDDTPDPPEAPVETGVGALPMRPPDPPLPPQNKFDDTPPPKGRAPAEMRSYSPSWSEWLGNKGQDVLMALGADPYSAGHVAHGLRDVGMLTPAGALVSGADVVHHSNQGQTKQAAWDALGVLPAANWARQAASGTAGARQIIPEFAQEGSAGFAFGRRPQAPSSERLIDEGAAGMRQYANSGATYPTAVGNNFVREARQELRSASQYAGNAPLTHEAVNEFERNIANNPHITASHVDEFHRALSNAAKKGEPGAMQMREKIYDYLGRGGDDTLREGVGNYAAGRRGERVDDVLEKSLRRGDANRALENQSRTLVESDRLHRGFLDREIEQLDAARRGTPTTRAMEGTADFITGQNAGASGIAGVASRMLPISGMTAAAGHALIPGGVGGAIGAAVPGGIASVLNVGAAPLRREAVTQVGEAIRNRSPLAQEILTRNSANPYYQPGGPGQSLLWRNAIAQELANRENREADAPLTPNLYPVRKTRTLGAQ